MKAIRDGVVYRFNGYRSKTVHGLYGMLPMLRAYYACSTGQGLAPLDERLGNATATPQPVSTMWLSRRQQSLPEESGSNSSDLSP